MVSVVSADGTEFFGRGLIFFSGVSDIQTDVATKKVVVTADDSVSPQEMLEKLQKVSRRE